MLYAVIVQAWAEAGGRRMESYCKTMGRGECLPGTIPKGWCSACRQKSVCPFLRFWGGS